jgi:hypothetical protein
MSTAKGKINRAFSEAPVYNHLIAAKKQVVEPKLVEM